MLQELWAIFPLLRESISFSKKFFSICYYLMDSKLLIVRIMILHKRYYLAAHPMF